MRAHTDTHTDTHKTKPVTAVLTRRAGHTSWMMGVWAAVLPLRTQPLKQLTLKPARARKLALMCMPLYKPSWYMHG